MVYSGDKQALMEVKVLVSTLSIGLCWISLLGSFCALSQLAVGQDCGILCYLNKFFQHTS